MNIFKRKKLVQIGPSVFIDVNEIVAVYPEGDFLTIRFSGVGVMKVAIDDLFKYPDETVDTILEALK